MEEPDILLISHPDHTRKALAADLEEWGYSTRSIDLATAQNAPERLERSYKLVILDTVRSWEESGRLLAEAIHNATDMPVLLIADKAGAVDTGEGGRSIGILRRPYSHHHLIRLVERHVATAAVSLKYAGLFNRLQDYTRTGFWKLMHGSDTPHFSASLRNVLGLGSRRSTSEIDELIDMVHPDDQPLVRKRYGEIIKGEPHHLEYRIIRPDGDVRHIRDSSFEGEKCGDVNVLLIGLLQDITEEWENRDKLLQCQKEMDEFAYVASHDLQEPLRAMTGFMQLLKNRYSDHLDDKGIDFIDRSCRAGHRMELLIKELLQLSRINTRGATFEPTDLNEIFTRVREKLRASWEQKQIAISCCQLPKVRCDNRQISTLFYNILENGVKFNTSELPTVSIDYRKNGDSHHFTIKDNGIGIAEEYQQRIFTVFQRLHTEKEYPGLGMGLTTAKKIVERHGGSIRLDSEPGKGTSFHFTLPSRDSLNHGTKPA